MTELLRPVWRTLPWPSLGAGSAAGLLLAGMARLYPENFDPWLALNTLRTAALAFALGLAFLLDDPARHTTATVPVPRFVRQSLRLALVAPIAALWWTATVLLIPAELRPPVGATTLEAGAACALALAGSAAWIRRSQEPEPGVSVAAGLLTVAVLAALLLPDDWELLVAVGDPGWDAAHGRWGVLLGAAVGGWLISTREPART
ncbi:ABC transporter [Streptomyces davaonensis]|uniref:ABC transporter n=1 Tax=Streptomyces davaonensis TaxID=348043 RepID=UPI00034CC92C|nr:ABC transporter [Streptomyces davaonensis]